jgi:hypothetical protein
MHYINNVKIFVKDFQRYYKSAKKYRQYYPFVAIFLFLSLTVIGMYYSADNTATTFQISNATDIEQFDLTEAVTPSISPSKPVIDKPETIAEIPQQPTTKSYEVALDTSKTIYGLTVDLTSQLPTDTDYYRVLLEDTNGKQYLVQEKFGAIAENSPQAYTSYCEESCMLDGVKPAQLTITSSIDTVLDLNNIAVVEDEQHFDQVEAEAVRAEQVADKLAEIKAMIAEYDLPWTADYTSISDLSYQERSYLTIDGTVPTLPGIEFYAGGIYKVPGQTTEVPMGTDPKEIMQRPIVSEWDWRKQHDADLPTSLYYDGDPDSGETGNGWLPAIRNQSSCGSCWAFSTVGTLEGYTNLYYNQHLDKNYSEQELVSCSSAGDCDGGWPNVAMEYIISDGIVNESCFPYTATNGNCPIKCPAPTEQVHINNMLGYNSSIDRVYAIKKLLIERGPLNVTVGNLNHAMALVGWETVVDETVWIFKNSWGTGYGADGYWYYTDDTSVYAAYAIYNELDSTQPETIACNDLDNDGFYNWGISPNQPDTCPSDAPHIKDCNDNDFDTQVFDAEYNCVAHENPLDLAFSSIGQNFPDTTVGNTSAPITIAIGNNSISPITITSITASDPVFSIDLLTCDGATLDPLDICEINVTFSPDTSIEYTGTIDVVASSLSYEFFVNGQGIGTAGVAVNQDPIEYVDKYQGYYSTREEIIIYNQGTLPLSISEISVADEEIFAVSMGYYDECNLNGQTLDPGDSCTVTVYFYPLTSGLHSTFLVINSDDPARPNYNIPVSGTAVAAPIFDIDPGFPDFGKVLIDDYRSQIITINNTGEEDLLLNNFTFPYSGYLGVDFDAGPAPCGSAPITIIPGGNCTIEMEIQAQITGYDYPYFEMQTNDVSYYPYTAPIYAVYEGITLADLANPQVACAYASGEWLASISKCAKTTEADCITSGGSFNSCDSTCLPGVGCTQNCVPLCSY